MFKKTLFLIALVALGSAIKLRGSKQAPEFLSEKKHTSFLDLDGSSRKKPVSFLSEELHLIDDSEVWAELPYDEVSLMEQINLIDDEESSEAMSHRLKIQAAAFQSKCAKKSFFSKAKCYATAMKLKIAASLNVIRAKRFGRRQYKKANEAYKSTKKRITGRYKKYRDENKRTKGSFGENQKRSVGGIEAPPAETPETSSEEVPTEGPSESPPEGPPETPPEYFYEGDDDELYEGDDDELYADDDDDLYEGDDDELYADDDDDLYEGDDDELFDDDDDLYEGDDDELYDDDDDLYEGDDDELFYDDDDDFE